MLKDLEILFQFMYRLLVQSIMISPIASTLTEALKRVQVFPERQGKWKATTQSQEFWKSVRRYYSNTITDGEKQDAMNLYVFSLSQLTATFAI